MNYLELARQLLAEEMLMEDRIDFLKEKNPVIDTSHDINAKSWDVTASGVIDHLASKADPTKNKTHTQWILGQYKQKNIRLEDSPRIHTALSGFEKYKGKLEKKDINSYKSVGEVEDAVAPHIGTFSSKREETKEIKTEGADLVHNDPESGMTIHHIKTEEAAKLYGKGTKWCTAADNKNMFNSYNAKGKLFVIQHKGEKFQYHREADQFMNDKDVGVSSEEFSKIKAPLHKAWKEHPEIAPTKNSEMDWKYNNKTEEDISRALEHPSQNVPRLAIQHPNVTTNNISNALDHDDDVVVLHAIKHPNVTPENINKALDSRFTFVRSTAIKHPKATTENISKALGDSYYSVKTAAIRNPEVNSEHISKALGDSDPIVRMAAIENPKATPDHISKALDDIDNDVRIAAIKHPQATPDHISKALDDINPIIRGAAIEHPKANSKHISTALGDKSWFVRDRALEITTKRKILESLQEDTTLRYHKELNPKIWNSEGNLQPNVEAHLVNIANDWIEFAKIPKDAIKNIVLTGGNCNYNYTSQSDLDVHIMLEYSKVSINKEILRDYYFSKKAIWASKHGDVNVSGYPVELFAQDISEKPHKGQGVYSLTKNEWIQKPDFLDLDLEHDQGVEYSAKEYATRINSTIKHDRGIDIAQPLIDEIYTMRGTGIADEGEFSKGTLIFKELRNLGMIDKLNKYILKQQDLGYSYAG